MPTARRRLPPADRAPGPRSPALRPDPPRSSQVPADSEASPVEAAPVGAAPFKAALDTGSLDDPHSAAPADMAGVSLDTTERLASAQAVAAADSHARDSASVAQTLAEPASSGLRRLTRPLEAWLRRHAPGRPLHPRTLRDRALARRLYRTLAREAALAALPDVRLFVASGTVAVEAVVTHALDRDLLLRLVASVRGVVAVFPRVTVHDSALAPPPAPCPPGSSGTASPSDSPGLP